MAKFILRTHFILLRVTIGLLTLVLAFALSKLVQETSLTELLAFEIFILPELLVTTGFLTLLALPALQFHACVAPDRPLHSLCQIALGLGTAPFVTMLALYAAHAPLILWLSPGYIAPYIALAVAGVVLLTVVAGIARSFVRGSSDHDPYPFLIRLHRIMRGAAAASALAFATIFFVSILVLGRPTTPETLTRAFVMVVIGTLLLRPQLTGSALTAPDHPWHILPHLALTGIALNQIKWMSRAVMFHTGQFTSFDVIDAVYPRVQTATMVLFIIFALVGIALALPPRDRPRHAVVPNEVFA